jgi:aryl-alcohol dehydrogenase-like predicted oxidoreductase
MLKKLPNTDIEISPMVYGAFAIGGWFWGGTDDSEAAAAIQAALDHGINAIDTAPIYGMGHSETLVGEAIKHRRNQAVVLTKFGMRWDIEGGDFAFDTKDNSGCPVKVYKFNGKQSVIEECERSLARLQTTYIDLYQMHWPDSTTPINETMEALEILLQQGKIRAAGVCNCPASLLSEANRRLPLSTNQVAYSMINRGIEKRSHSLLH